jgi:hypothetical protein
MTTWHTVQLAPDTIARWNPKTRTLELEATGDCSTIIFKIHREIVDQLAELITLAAAPPEEVPKAGDS